MRPQDKSILRKVYLDFYTRMAWAIPGNLAGKRMLEVGSGQGFIKEVIPNCQTSDIEHGSGLCFSAEAIPCCGEWYDAILALDVLHHLDRPDAFFREAIRCLKVGGRVVMIEPSGTTWARFIYRHFHHEPWYDGILYSRIHPNQAVAWLIFVKQRGLFEQMYPRLRIVSIAAHTPFAYVLSGGLSRRWGAPLWIWRPVVWLDRKFARWGLFMTIVCEKVS